MLSVKQGSIKYHFLSLWYDSTKDWTPISWAIVEHANHYAKNELLSNCVRPQTNWFAFVYVQSVLVKWKQEF